jgi:hypothetical protein
LFPEDEFSFTFSLNSIEIDEEGMDLENLSKKKLIHFIEGYRNGVNLVFAQIISNFLFTYFLNCFRESFFFDQQPQDKQENISDLKCYLSYVHFLFKCNQFLKKKNLFLQMFFIRHKQKEVREDT